MPQTLLLLLFAWLCATVTWLIMECLGLLATKTPSAGFYLVKTAVVVVGLAPFLPFLIIVGLVQSRIEKWIAWRSRLIKRPWG